MKLKSSNTGFTRRLYSVHTTRPQRAYGALEDPTALLQRPHSALSNTLCKRQPRCFEHVLNKSRRIAIYAVAQRLHSVSTALLATAQRAPRRSATFLTLWKRCEDAALV